MSEENFQPGEDAIVRVGAGRGFIVEHDGFRYVITASHCLTRPFEVRRAIDEENEHAVLPPPMSAMYDAERTYPNLLGPLDGECGVSAECLFVDPIADIAVLGQPDSQELYEQADAYDSLVEGAEPFSIGELLPEAAASAGCPVARLSTSPEKAKLALGCYLLTEHGSHVGCITIAMARCGLLMPPKLSAAA